MAILNSRARGTARGLWLLTLAGLVVSLFGTTALKNASHRVTSPTQAAANVYVDPLPSKTLWVGTMDPSLITSLTDAEVVGKIYAGLVKQRYNDTTKQFTIVPDLADGMPKVSKDGRVYTFKIRSDAKFSDGTPVTAQDFVWSFKRVLDPKAASPANYYLFAIKGASDYSAGRLKSFSDVGVKALNAHTLQITLAKPVVWFLYALSYDTGFVVKRSLPIGAKVTTNPALVVGAGPWMLKNHTWKYRQQITLVPNPYYYDAKNFKLKEIDEVFTGSAETNFNGYKSGQFPITQIPSAEVASNRGRPDFHETVVLGDVWYTMNMHIKPFTDIHFRRAIAYAINRKAIAQGVLHGTVKPQYGWYPQGIIGYDPNILSNSGVPRYDPAIARKELAMAKKDLGSIPSIQFEYNTEEEDRARGAAEVQQELKAIGITMTLHPVPGTTWIKDGNSGKTPFMFADWYDDYPDPQDFSYYLIETGAAENWGRYSNPRVDALFAKADVERDKATRENLYKQAQLIILRDAPVAMLYQFAAQDLISPRYHGIEMNPSWGTFPQPVKNDWANVSVSP
jgi:oligopeptide transport system substrate-binding protein